MKIAILGATGMAGSRILAEALDRGHAVTGVARDPGRLPSRAGLTPVRADVLASGLADILSGHDAVVSAMHFTGVPPGPIIAAAKVAKVRLLVVGGAGSLEVAPGVHLVDTPEFPGAYKAEASAGRDFLNVLRGETGLDWTSLSPSALFEPGERTGRFRLGGDALLVDGAGKSRISAEDYAIALLDEIEHPRHVRQRFTVGY